MEKFIITGGKALNGFVKVGGAKNVAMKVILAGILTDERLTVHNIPLISSVLGTTQIVEPLGMSVLRKNHTLQLSGKNIHRQQVPLELGGLYRTAPMVMGPLLARFGKAVVPNPGGCRLGKRPVNWHVEALKQMGATITYKDGYYHAHTKQLTGTRIKFVKNTHTGTETVLLAAVLAKGRTIIENGSEEPEVDDLIKLLLLMGADISRDKRTIIINGVKRLSGAEMQIMYDRNEVVTYAIGAITTKGSVTVEGTQREYLQAFLNSLDQVGAGWEEIDKLTTRFFWKGPLKSSDIQTRPYPGFMTDWQAPWSVLTTQAIGISTIHETVFESRFSYALELRKMGAKIDFFEPDILNPKEFYNFNWRDKVEGYYQGIRVTGKTALHEAVVEITDLRAGATLVLAALVARGKSVIHGIEQIDRGYEEFDKRLKNLGAHIVRMKEDYD